MCRRGTLLRTGQHDSGGFQLGTSRIPREKVLLVSCLTMTINNSEW